MTRSQERMPKTRLLTNGSSFVCDSPYSLPIISRFRHGFSLVNSMFSIAVLLVAVIGTSNYRYHSTLFTRRAEMLTSASRIGILLCESWRGVGGNESYDPTNHLGAELSIIEENNGLAVPEGFTHLGSYKVTSDNINYYVALFWKDIESDLRALNVVVVWSNQCQVKTNLKNVHESFKLTTYTLH